MCVLEASPMNINHFGKATTRLDTLRALIFCQKYHNLGKAENAMVSLHRLKMLVLEPFNI